MDPTPYTLTERIRHELMFNDDLGPVVQGLLEEAADELERAERDDLQAAEWREEHGWGVPGSDLDADGNLVG